jgi:hypothetical protein
MPQGGTSNEVLAAVALLTEEVRSIKSITTRQQDEIDELKSILDGLLSQDDEKQLRALVQEVKKTKNMDGRAVVGHVKKTLGISTPYAKATLPQAMNVLKVMLGRGLTTVK